MALFQVNQLSSFVEQSLSVPPLVTGAFCALFVGNRIKRWNSTISPCDFLDGASYVFNLCFGVARYYYSEYRKVPVVFTEILGKAFSGGALFGGAQGNGCCRDYENWD